MKAFAAWLARFLVVVGLGAGVYLGYDYRTRREAEARLEEERQRTEAERQRAEHYKGALQNVLAETKTTRFRLLKSEPDGETDLLSLSVAQWNAKDEKVFAKEFQLRGRKIYFEGVVVHFQPEAQAEGKANLHLLTRVFSDVVPPAQGIWLIDEQIRTAASQVGEIPDLSQDSRLRVQQTIQRLLDDPDFAKKEGVRTVNNQAVCDTRELMKDYVYTLVEKADGGYLIERQPIP